MRDTRSPSDGANIKLDGKFCADNFADKFKRRTYAGPAGTGLSPRADRPRRILERRDGGECLQRKGETAQRVILAIQLEQSFNDRSLDFRRWSDFRRCLKSRQRAHGIAMAQEYARRKLQDERIVWEAAPQAIHVAQSSINIIDAERRINLGQKTGRLGLGLLADLRHKRRSHWRSQSGPRLAFERF